VCILHVFLNYGVFVVVLGFDSGAASGCWCNIRARTENFGELNLEG